MTTADARFKRYDPWYVKVTFGLFVGFNCGLTGCTTQRPQFHRAIGNLHVRMALSAEVASEAMARILSSRFSPKTLSSSGMPRRPRCGEPAFFFDGKL
jgi:hypothetical protein